MSEPAELSRAAIEANRAGLQLRSQGRLTEAAQAFGRAAQTHPGIPELQLNHAITLTELQQYGAAREAYARVLLLRPFDASAHWALYDLEQMAGNREQALEHQTAALQNAQIFSSYAPQQQRRILAVMAPGDWQANVPVDYLIDRQTSTLHKLFLVSQAQAESVRLPQADVILNAIAQSPHNEKRLQWAQTLIERAGLPCINEPHRVAAADRESAARALRGVANVHAPQAREHAREDLLQQAGALTYPSVVRPLDSQAGRDFAKIDGAQEMRSYLERVPAAAFYVMPFIDYANADGYYRKYRVFVVAGVPYPCHLGISRDWMVHYYNTPMAEHQWMRDEERHFIEQFDTVFSAQQRAAMAAVAQTLKLEYTGLDCSIDGEGNVLLFEADPAMIVHTADDPALFAYKHAAARNIFAAFAALADNARSR